MIKFNDILEGWSNAARDVVGVLDQKKKALSLARLEKCNKCPLQSGLICDPRKTYMDMNGCGCVLVPKSLVNSNECPLRETKYGWSK